MTCRHCHPDKHPQRTNCKSLNDYKIQLKTKKEQEDKEQLKCPFVNTKDEKRSCKPSKSFVTIEALATHCKRAHKMTPNQVTEIVRSLESTTENNTKQKPKVRFRINDNTEHNTKQMMLQQTVTQIMHNLTTQLLVQLRITKEYTITKNIECIVNITHVIRIQGF